MSDRRDSDSQAAEAAQAPQVPPEASDPGAPEGEAVEIPPQDQRPRPRLLPMWILIAAVVIVGVAWALSERYFGTAETGKSVPLVVAEDTPVKVRPDEPGGVEVPDRDKYVYKSLTDGDGEAESEGEQLLPLPEEPMQRPPVEVVELAVPEPATETAKETAKETVEEVVETEIEAASEPPPVDQQTIDEMTVAELEAPQDAVADVAVEAAPEAIEPEPAPEAAAEEPEVVEQEIEDADEPAVAAVEASEAVVEEKKFEQILEPAPEPAPEPEPTPVAATEPEPEPEPEPEAQPEPEPEAQPEAEPEPPAAPVKTAALSADTPGFLVQIGAVQEESAAAGEIARLTKKHPDILTGLGSIVIRADLGDKGVWYRMRVGPFDSRAEADGVCGQLKAVDVGCFVVAN